MEIEFDVAAQQREPDPAPKPTAPPPKPITPTMNVGEADADFFRRMAAEMRAFEPNTGAPDEVQLRRINGQLARVYFDWANFALKAHNYPVGDYLILDMKNTAVLQDAKTLYMRLIHYAEGGGNYPDDKHKLALDRLSEYFSPTNETNDS